MSFICCISFSKSKAISELPSNEKTVAGREFASMSVKRKQAVCDELTKTLQKTVNRQVKESVVKVKYQNACEAANEKMLKEIVPSYQDMVRAPPPKIGRSGSCPDVCLGDYVEVSCDYYPGTGICSEGRCGCVLNIRDFINIV